jgi:hypothetical protein
MIFSGDADRGSWAAVSVRCPVVTRPGDDPNRPEFVPLLTAYHRVADLGGFDAGHFVLDGKPDVTAGLTMRNLSSRQAGTAG